MSFSSWLQNELNKRGFSQSDLVRSSKSAGYQISSMQISRVLNQDRGAGPDTCIAIAHGLGIPREEVFRARGWLLHEPQEVVPQKASPKATAVIRGLTELSLERQEVVSEALLAQLSVVAQIIQETGFDNF